MLHYGGVERLLATGLLMTLGGLASGTIDGASNGAKKKASWNVRWRFMADKISVEDLQGHDDSLNSMGTLADAENKLGSNGVGLMVQSGIELNPFLS